MEPSPEVLAFAQPLAPVVVSAALAPVAALLSAATVASPEEEVAAAEAALGEAVAVVPSVFFAGSFAKVECLFVGAQHTENRGSEYQQLCDLRLRSSFGNEDVTL